MVVEELLRLMRVRRTFGIVLESQQNLLSLVLLGQRRCGGMGVHKEVWRARRMMSGRVGEGIGRLWWIIA